MLLIEGARVMDPASGRDEVTDLLLDGGRIARIGPCPPGVEAERLDAHGLVAAPGLVDMHVHFRDPGQTWKEDLQTGAEAALHGGFTTVVCMANTAPPIDNPEALGALLRREARAPIHILQAAAVTKGLAGGVLNDLPALDAAGAALFTDDGAPLLSSALALRAMREAAALGKVLSLHEEDAALIAESGVNAGAAAAALGLSGAPAAAEESLVARDCVLALHSGARVHIQHVSAGGSVDILRAAQALGARVSAEAAPHHFTLCEDDVLRHGTNAKMNPPLRTARDREKIIEGLRDGTIGVIATDHAPHAREEKARPFKDAPSGIVGLETSLALGITHLVRPGHLTLMALLEKMTVNPARLCAPGAGALLEGGPADVVLFDPCEEWTPGKLHSKSQNSPFLGLPLTGRVRWTVARGVPRRCWR